MRKMFCCVVIAWAIGCSLEAYAADMNIIMPFRAAKLSRWDGTAVDETKTIGKMLDSFENSYCRKIVYENLKKADGSITILVGCIVDFDKFPYSSQLKNKYQEIKFVMSFEQQGTYIFPSGQGNYPTDLQGIVAGRMQSTLVSIQDTADKMAGKSAYVADYELHRSGSTAAR